MSLAGSKYWDGTNILSALPTLFHRIAANTLLANTLYNINKPPIPRLFKRHLDCSGTSLLFNTPDRRCIHNIIFDELCVGRFEATVCEVGGSFEYGCYFRETQDDGSFSSCRGYGISSIIQSRRTKW
jgi:hypothetical protein